MFGVSGPTLEDTAPYSLMTALPNPVDPKITLAAADVNTPLTVASPTIEVLPVSSVPLIVVLPIV